MKKIIASLIILAFNVLGYSQTLPMHVIDSSSIAQNGLHPELEKYVRSKIGITDSLLIPTRLKERGFSPKKLDLKGGHEYLFQSFGQKGFTEIVFFEVEREEIINWLISILMQIDKNNPLLIEQLENTECVYIPVNEVGCCYFEINENGKRIILRVTD